MSNPDLSDIRFEALRVPIDCAVDLRFESADDPIRLQAVNISMSGMFIRSATMVQPGTACTVAFELREGGPAIRATAEVLWNRERDKGADRPKGLGIRFLELELDGKYAISRLVEQYISLGEMPFHLGGTNHGGPDAATSKVAGRTPLWIALAFLIGLTIGSLGSLWMFTAPSDEIVEPGITASSPRAFSPRSAGENEPPSLEPTRPDRDVAKPEADADASAAAIESSVAAWARAWSEKDVERYLACYSDRFRPTSGVPLDTWQAQRRKRLSRPSFIEVEISSLEVEQVAPDHVIARFQQDFASPDYSDRVTKRLELVWEERAWRVIREEIVRELADPPLTPASESAHRSASPP